MLTYDKCHVILIKQSGRSKRHEAPQIFEKELIIQAHEYAKEHGLSVTDDSMLVEAIGVPVYIVEGAYTNIKITTPEDLIIAEKML